MCRSKLSTRPQGLLFWQVSRLGIVGKGGILGFT